MKQTDRLKKEKSPTVKTQIMANSKKAEPKKVLPKKEETNIPKSTSFITFSPQLRQWTLQGSHRGQHRHPIRKALQPYCRLSQGLPQSQPRRNKVHSAEVTNEKQKNLAGREEQIGDQKILSKRDKGILPAKEILPRQLDDLNNKGHLLEGRTTLA